MSANSNKLNSLLKSIILNALEDLESQNLTPYFAINCFDLESNELLDVPSDFVNQNRITLNLKSQAALNLHLHQKHLTFSARFRGVSREVSVPYESIEFIFSQEVTSGKRAIPIYFVDLSNKDYLNTIAEQSSVVSIRDSEVNSENEDSKKKVILRKVQDNSSGTPLAATVNNAASKARVKPVLRPVE